MARKLEHKYFVDLYNKYYDAWKERYAEGAEDLRFAAGDQWPEDIQKSRGSRPCLTINKMWKFIKSVSGDQKQNRAEAKAYPVDGKGDPALAEVFHDLIRHIEYKSNAYAVYDSGFTQCLAGSIGFWRILSEYESPDSFDQGLRIRKIRNPFSVLIDPEAKDPNYTDARACFIVGRISVEDFKNKYPGKALSNFGAADSSLMYAQEDVESLLLAECYIFQKKKKRIAQASDGSVFELTGGVTVEGLTEEGIEIINERTAEHDVLYWYKLSGSEILESEEQPGKYIPVICIPGDELDITGKPVMFSLIRHAKDPQRMYNYFHSASVETQALQPHSPWLVTATHIKGYEPEWREYPRKLTPVLRYNVDPIAGKPDRIQPPTTNTGAFSEMGKLDQEMYDTTGITQPSLGEPSNERSGKALILRQRASDKAVFSFFDNQARAIEHTARILINLIPHYYDTERIIRVMGDDNTIREVTINSVQQNPDTFQAEIVNSLKDAGEYDVVAKSGPSYETKRQQTAEFLMQFIQYAPNFAPVIAPILAKSLDAPGSSELAKVMLALSPPQVQAALGATPSPVGEQALGPREPLISESSVGGRV